MRCRRFRFCVGARARKWVGRRTRCAFRWRRPGGMRSRRATGFAWGCFCRNVFFFPNFFGILDFPDGKFPFGLPPIDFLQCGL